MNILLVYPVFPDTFWSFKHALRFVHKKASSPPLGLITVAALLPKTWQKRLVDMNVEHLRDADIQWADLVFVSAMVVQRTSTYEAIHRCKKAGKVVVAGGPIFLGEWQKFPEVDHFILNEGEITLPEFLRDFETGNAKRVYTTEEYADLTQSPLPLWELVKHKHYDSLAIQYSRGCPFNCDFCNITAMLGHRPRTKSAAQIIAELNRMSELGWASDVFFVDDNFIGNSRQLKEEILPAIIEWRKENPDVRFITEASINLADDPKLIEMMTTAGFKSIFVGIETPDDGSLEECHKSQNLRRDLAESVNILQRNGLQVMGGFIVGFDNDTSTIFRKQVDFIQRTGIVTAMVGLLQAPYGTKLYQRMSDEGRILHEMTGDNADGSTNILPKMGIEKLNAGYKRLLMGLYEPKFFYQRVKTFLSVYKPAQVPVTIHLPEVQAFFTSIWKLGIVGRERSEYWKLIFWTLARYPKKFALAITFAIYGYHFRRINEGMFQTP
jgi:radical SAM superfamily enzyme YgiQ (UPF0313 family)